MSYSSTNRDSDPVIERRDGADTDTHDDDNGNAITDSKDHHSFQVNQELENLKMQQRVELEKLKHQQFKELCALRRKQHRQYLETESKCQRGIDNRSEDTP